MAKDRVPGGVYAVYTPDKDDRNVITRANEGMKLVQDLMHPYVTLGAPIPVSPMSEDAPFEAIAKRHRRNESAALYGIVWWQGPKDRKAALKFVTTLPQTVRVIIHTLYPLEKDWEGWMEEAVASRRVIPVLSTTPTYLLLARRELEAWARNLQ